MKKVHIVDFIDFLRTHEALAGYLAAVKEQNVAVLVDFSLTNTRAWSWLNGIIWEATDEGQAYWESLQKEWHEEIGFSWEEEAKRIERIKKLAEESVEEGEEE